MAQVPLRDWPEELSHAKRGQKPGTPRDAGEAGSSTSAGLPSAAEQPLSDEPVDRAVVQGDARRRGRAAWRPAAAAREAHHRRRAAGGGRHRLPATGDFPADGFASVSRGAAVRPLGKLPRVLWVENFIRVNNSVPGRMHFCRILPGAFCGASPGVGIAAPYAIGRIQRKAGAGEDRPGQGSRWSYASSLRRWQRRFCSAVVCSADRRELPERKRFHHGPEYRGGPCRMSCHMCGRPVVPGAGTGLFAGPSRAAWKDRGMVCGTVHGEGRGKGRMTSGAAPGAPGTAM